MPVPPVVMTTCTSALARCRSIVPRTRSASSLTMARPATACPAAVSSSAMARPLVSVSSVRVSLIVTMTQRTDEGARALCSAWDIGVIVTPCVLRSAVMKAARIGLISCSCLSALVAIGLAFEVAAAPRDPFTLDRAAERWVEQTRKTLTADEKIGQLIVPTFESSFLSTDSDTFETLTRLVRDYHVGGFHVFGASVPAPSVLLNPGYGTVILGQPFSAAFLINRLQALSTVPLLNTADFETGVGFRLAGATQFPRQMAMGAIAPGAEGHDARLVREEARVTGVESRALGVHVNFAPVADVNNNARNPVINIRSYGE